MSPVAALGCFRRAHDRQPLHERHRHAESKKDVACGLVRSEAPRIIGSAQPGREQAARPRIGGKPVSAGVRPAPRSSRWWRPAGSPRLVCATRRCATPRPASPGVTCRSPRAASRAARGEARGQEPGAGPRRSPFNDRMRNAARPRGMCPRLPPWAVCRSKCELGVWWSQAESNRRPLECHSSALPTELWPHSNSRAWGPGKVVRRSGGASLAASGREIKPLRRPRYRHR